MSHRDVSRNPNITRNGPPPPLYEELPPGGVAVEEVHHHHHGSGMMGMPMGIGMHHMGMGVPLGLPPPYTPFANPFHPVPTGFLPPPPPFVAGIASPPAFATPGYAWHGTAAIAAPPIVAPAVVPTPAPVIAPPVVAAAGMIPGFGFGAPFTTGDFGPVPPAQTDASTFAGGRIWGVTTIEAAEHTILGWIKTHYPPWLVPGQPLALEWIHVDSGWSLNRLIKAMRENQDCIGWAVTECFELGTGTWQQGSTYVWGTPVTMHQGLSDVGWDKKRNRTGEGCTSLHVYLHRV